MTTQAPRNARKPAPAVRLPRGWTEDDIIRAAQAIATARLDARAVNAIEGFADAARLIAARLRPMRHEVFAALYVDSQHRPIAFRELFRGTIDGASVYPREVVADALDHNAAAVIFAHNHPSGVAEPSLADRQITRRLVDALALVDIRVLDHFVIGAGDPVSFSERGIL